MPGFIVAWLGTGFVLAGVVLFFDMTAHDRVVLAELSETPSPVGHRSGRRRRLIILTIVVVVAVVWQGFSLASGGYDPLRAAGPAIGSGPLYVGTQPATYGGVDETVFAAVPGGEIQMEFSLVNSGEFPMTVTGFDYSSGGLAPLGYVESGLLMPADQASGGSGRGAQGRIEIQAHASVRVVATLRLKQCPEWLPTPTLAPGQSPSAVNAMAATSAFQAGGLPTLPVIYDMLGFRHVSNVALPAYLTLAVLDQAGCGGINSSVNLPLGVHATPVPSFQYP
jgi:hypothetical protein